MAWTTPTTRSTGDLITAANWNTDVVDNLIYLHDSLPACRVYNSANISIPNSGSYTYLTFDSERFDTDGMHSTVTNTGRLTVVTPGVYVISGSFELASTAGGGNPNGYVIRLNGTTKLAEFRGYINFGAGQIQTIYKLAANDYVEFGVSQNSGAAINCLANGNNSPEFGMARIAGG